MSIYNLGTKGEELIKEKLLKAGWEILHTNYRHIGTELDIVAWMANTLLIVEVKTRRTDLDKVLIEDLLPQRKIDALRRGVDKIITKLNIEVDTIRCGLALVQVGGGANPPFKTEWFEVYL